MAQTSLPLLEDVLPADLPASCRQALDEHLVPDIFRALADPTRLTLLARFASSARPLTVGEAAECCGVHLSGVSRHLSALRDAGILTAEKQGREVRYAIDCSAIAGALRGAADALESCQSACC